MYYWNKANERSLIAKRHAELMENTKTDLIESSVAESKIYESCAVQAPTAPATFKLLNTDSVSAIMMQDGDKRIGILNFASCELLRLIEVGASCFNHYCIGYDVT